MSPVAIDGTYQILAKERGGGFLGMYAQHVVHTLNSLFFTSW